MASASIYGAFRVIGANSVQVTAIVGVANMIGAFGLLFAKRYIKGDFRHDRLTGMFVFSDGLASSKGQTVWIYNLHYRRKTE